jgi:hypothetical protein
VVGREAVDREGVFVGTVRDSVPLDGGGEAEMLLLNVGRRFATRRYVPTRGVRVEAGRVHLPVLRGEIEDAPNAEDRRWGDPVGVARGYWVFATD